MRRSIGAYWGHEPCGNGLAWARAARFNPPVIATIEFRRFKALRHTRLDLAPFNLVVGPNGSGKTSLIQAILQLRNLARGPAAAVAADLDDESWATGPEVTFRFAPPWDGFEVVMGCRRGERCDALMVESRPGGGDPAGWSDLRTRLPGVRAYLLDHYAIAAPAAVGAALQTNGGNLAAVLADWADRRPEALAGLRADLLRLLPEYDDLRVTPAGEGGGLVVALRLRDGGDWVEADGLSQGTLYALALGTIAYDPEPPPVVCIEELDRGLHPRLLREIRDVFYRLSYPEQMGVVRTPVQVIATTHSPYLLDLFKDHPEEVVIAEKSGSTARFSRLADREDLALLLEEGSLGDIWFAGLLGGVPEDK